MTGRKRKTKENYCRFITKVIRTEKGRDMFTKPIPKRLGVPCTYSCNWLRPVTPVK